MEKTNPIKITNNDIKEYIKFHENIFSKEINISDIKIENSNISEPDIDILNIDISKIFDMNASQTKIAETIDSEIRLDFSNNKIFRPELNKTTENSIKSDFSDNKAVQPELTKPVDNSI